MYATLIPMQIIDGRLAKQYYIPKLMERIKGLSFIPKLAIIQIGNRPDSDSYIKAKKSFAVKIGVKEEHIQFDEKVSQEEVIEIIKKLNNDKTVQGIIVQLPLPLHLNTEIIIETIDPRKDLDGLTSRTLFMPATARGVSQLFDFYNINLNNKKVTVIGRSKLVGTPIAGMCRNRKAIVTVCHSKTENIREETRDADILIVAIGKAKLINREYIKKDQIIIDVGISRQPDNTLSGDVDFDNVKDIVAMISPVPGGVGQMTVLALFENLIDSCYNVR